MSDARCLASSAAPPSMTSPAMKIIAGAKIATNSAADPRSARRPQPAQPAHQSVPR